MLLVFQRMKIEFQFLDQIEFATPSHIRESLRREGYHLQGPPFDGIYQYSVPYFIF